MNISSAVFNKSASDLDSCPRSRLPEFAFIGRSNVGKSSLINMLTMRKDLAKVSGTPGKTRLINFFTINGAWSLVDLPGYGYAKVRKGEQLGFNQAAAEYLEKREGLTRVFILIDSRYEVMQIDLEFIAWAREIDVAYSLVFTKTDKVSKTVWEENIAIFKENLAANDLQIPKILTSSSPQRKGRGEILSHIQSLLPKKTTAKKKATVSLGWMKK